MSNQTNTPWYPILSTSLRSRYEAPHLVNRNMVIKHFQQKHDDVKALLKSVKSARMKYVWYETHLGMETSPSDILKSKYKTYPNLSKDEVETEALNLTKLRRNAADTVQSNLVKELNQVLHKDPHTERLEWVQREYRKHRIEADLLEIEDSFAHPFHMKILELYSEDHEKISSFILEEWSKMTYQIGQQELKWISFINQREQHDIEKEPGLPVHICDLIDKKVQQALLNEESHQRATKPKKFGKTPGKVQPGERSQTRLKNKPKIH